MRFACIRSASYDPRREQDVLRYLLETDVLVLPYRNLAGTLGLPLIVLEGLAARCVVVSRDVGDIPRFIARNGLVMHDLDELAGKLEGLSDAGAIEARRSQIDTSDLFSTFVLTRVADRLLSYL
jgi:glycosyltransferase involved in cell wall biosynthesis